MDKGTLFTLALSYLGERDYVTDTPSAEACEAMAQHVIGLALDFHRWSFAQRRTLLDFSSGEALLPADCLRVLSLGLGRYERFNDLIVTDEARADVVLVYESNMMAQAVALPDTEPAFCEGVVLLLASKIAPRVTTNFNLASALEQRAYAALDAARHKDAVQVDSNDQRPDASSVPRGVHPFHCD